MQTEVTATCTLALTEDERRTLVSVLEEVLKRVRVEEHRTKAITARQVVYGYETRIESLLTKARVAHL